MSSNQALFGLDIFLFIKITRPNLEVHLASYSVGTVGARWLVHETEPLPSSCAKVENEWSCTSISSVCLNGLFTDSFYCCFIALVLEMGSLC
jgi:hypothetical protein